MQTILLYSSDFNILVVFLNITCGKHLRDRIISQRGDDLAHQTS